MLFLINQFQPLIRKYSRKLNYDGAETDLTINLIEVIKKIPIDESKDMIETKYLIGYISKSLLYKYIRLYKKTSEQYSKETELKEDIANNGDLNIDIKLMLKDAIVKLPESQKNILKKIYIEGWKETDIAKQLNISRQAVNKTKRLGLNNLKKHLIS